MISYKDAKKFLSKDNQYKVSKEDVESFKKIFKSAPKTIKNNRYITKILKKNCLFKQR